MGGHSDPREGGWGNKPFGSGHVVLTGATNMRQKCDQIAFYAPDTTTSEMIKRMLGLTNEPWVYDTVTGRSRVRGSEAQENVADLQFNESLGIQLEIIRYIRGPHWLQLRPDFNDHRSARTGMPGGAAIISHVGIHLDESEPWPNIGAPLVQHTITTNHSSAHYSDPNSPTFGRQYEYKIYEMAPTTHIKYIRRIPRGMTLDF